MVRIRYILISLAFLCSLGNYAYDFSVTLNGQQLYFDITNKSKRTACVTFNANTGSGHNTHLKGTVEIPEKVRYNNVVYNITAIGQKAFADAKNLEGIIIPSGIESIGDFAFEDCSSLKKIVFPGNIVKLGQGVFFKCNSISSVSIGSDWESIDLTMFRWSNHLKEITIPAKIDKIEGLKKVKSLERINVDSNNSTFSSYDGILYSKNGKNMYACPRRYAAEVIIKDGTETIVPGALIDCISTEKIVFPGSLKNVSFRETSRMKHLASIIMKPVKPVITAYKGNQGLFLFQLCNPKTEIIVENQSKSKYINLLPKGAGQYSEKIGGVPFEIRDKEIPTKKNIKGVKNFNKY